MSFTYQLTQAAENDIYEAFLWYEEQQAGLGGALLGDLERAFETIAAHPKRYPIISKDRRRFLLKAMGSRFGAYLIMYRVDETEKTVTIVALIHSSRNPSTWESR